MVTFVETNGPVIENARDESVSCSELKTRADAIKSEWDGRERLKRAREAQRQTEYLYRLLFVNVCEKAS